MSETRMQMILTSLKRRRLLDVVVGVLFAAGMTAGILALL